MNAKKMVSRLAKAQFTLVLIASLFLPAAHLAAEPLPSIADYIDDLLAMQPLSESRSGVRMDIEVVHDAYLYMMALKYEEYENYGFDEDLIVSKLKSDHVKYKRYQNRLFFRIHIAGEGSHYVMFAKKLSSHLEVTQKSKKTFFSKRTYHILKEKPKVKPAPWQIFSKSKTRLTKKNLFGFDKLQAEVTSLSLKGQNKEPIYFKLKDIRVQRKSGDPHESINIVSKQVGTKKGWNGLLVPGPAIVLTPGNWQIPLPPQGFLNALKKLGYK